MATATFRIALIAAAVAAALPGALVRADEAAFVNVAGREPALLAAMPGGAGDPAIEKLLTRPSDLWERLRQGFALRDLDTPLVAKYEAWYAARPELLRSIFGRGKRYLHYIVEEVDRRGMPAELALLPAVESGFNPMALSSANASGLWQFIPGTGTRYKLTQTAHFDARRDVTASTGAALDYLQELHKLVGDWHLALASYNWGENSVIRAVSQSRTRGRNGVFEDLSMPDETRNYVPRLLALRNIVAEPERFGLNLGDLADEPYFVTLPLESSVDLRVAARLAGLPYEDLLALNPGYNRPHAPGALSASLIVPVESADVAREGFEKYFEERARQKGPRKR